MQGEWTRRQLSRRAFCRLTGVALAATTVAVPAVTAAQEATPAASPAGGALASMLAMAPAAYPQVDSSAPLMINVADIAAQLAVTGVERPDSVDDASFPAWAAATQSLGMATEAVRYLSFWRQDYGFDLMQADQTLELALPPFNLTLFRGRFDVGAVRAKLVANGYREIEVDGYTLLSLRDDFKVDIASPFAYKMAAMNHAAFLEDGTLAFSSVKAALAGVLDVVAGKAPSLMEHAGFAMVVEQAPADLVGATIVQGTMLTGDIPAGLFDPESGATPDISAIATEIADRGEMPPVAMALLGVTAGGPLFDKTVETPAGVPDARAVAVLLMLSPGAAEAAVPVIEERLATGVSEATGEPFSRWFAEYEVSAVPSKPLVIADLTLAPETLADILTTMLYRRDLGFLAW